MKVTKVVLSLAIALSLTSQLNAQNRKLRLADTAFESAEYHRAQELYKNAYSKSSDRNEKQEISFKMAECARLTGNYRQAESYYKRTVKMRYEDPVAMLYLAQAQHNLGKFDQALEHYQKYQAAVPGDVRANEGIVACNLAIEWMDNPTRYDVINMKSLNSRENDFSPAYANKDYTQVYFSTTREGVVGARVSKQTGEYFPDIYETNKEKQRRSRKKGAKKAAPKWSDPISIDEKADEIIINTEHEEGVMSLNERGNIMYYTKADFVKKEYNGRRIFKSRRKGGKWEEGQVVELPIDSLVDVQHPAISPDEKTLYFSSEMEGGYGGTDIWYSVYNKRKKNWTKPKNLGPLVNTAGNEAFPYVHKDGTLFFASTGHPGLGGYDVYRSNKDKNDQFGAVENMKYPINSTYDDFGLIFEGDEYKSGFVTSNRKGGRGGDDIYSVKLADVIFKLDGQVTDNELGKPMVGVNVKLVGSNGTVFDVITDKDGNYEFESENIEKEVEYELSFSKETYLSKLENYTTVGLTINDFERTDDGFEYVTSRDVVLTYDREPVVLPHLEFDFASSELRTSAKADLDKLKRVLDTNPDLVIELRAHTDHIGGEEANQTLSQARAQSCVDYLISLGISQERMKALGMGETEPYVIKEDVGAFKKGDVLTETYISKLKRNADKDKARQMNRRTDFKKVVEEKKAVEFGEY